MPGEETENDDSGIAAPFTCFRCNCYGHAWNQCQREPAKTRQELNNRITDIVIRWDAGTIRGFGSSVKKRIIELEIRAFDRKAA